MKIAISANSADLNQQANPTFGRCPGFIIAEIEGKKVKNSSFVENASAMSPGGAGTSAAQSVVEMGVEAVISGNLGPKAAMVLQQAGIKVYQVSGLTVEETINQMADGKLKEMDIPKTQGLFGMGGRGFGQGRAPGAGRGFGRGMAGQNR